MKYRLYPTKHQQRLLDETLDTCRQVYNQTLAHRKEAWEQRQETLSLYDTNAMLTQWKRERPVLSQVHSQVLQNAQERVDLAFKAFFRRCKAGDNPGYPRFRGPGRYDSFTFKQSGFALQDSLLRVSKIGAIRLVLHRPIEGMIKVLTLRRAPSGKGYACFSIEVEPAPLPDTASAVGIDVGLSSFATLSTGEHIANLRFFRTNEWALAKAERHCPRHRKAHQSMRGAARW